ncbi:hypothetical protein M9435_003047 [Picochlorum sp. BPE23]|nr:hypothetical protein M9435_003047 [Picochlorum sp. BPE23]
MMQAVRRIGVHPCGGLGRPVVQQSHGRRHCGHGARRTILKDEYSNNSIDGRFCRIQTRAEPEKDDDSPSSPQYNTEFGYSRKDVIIIGVVLIAMGYILYYGLQYAFGMDAIMAGNWAQLIIFVGLCVGWIGSYLFRVATKQMTYAKQLDDYEEAVMRKRLEELPETEFENMMMTVEEEKKMIAERRRQNAKDSE